MRKTALLLLVLSLPLLAGCFGAAGYPLPVDRLTHLRTILEDIDDDSPEGASERLRSLQQEVAAAAGSKDRAVRADLGRKQLLIGYCWERRGEFPDAQAAYAQAAGSEYGSVALFRTAQVAELLAAQAQDNIGNPDVAPETRYEAEEILKLQRQRTMKALERGANYPINTRVLVRTPAVASLPLQSWRLADLRHEAYSRLDKYYQERLIYRIFEVLVRLCGGPDRNYSYLLIIPLLALLAKLITTPFSAAQFRSMRAMQALQPELKKLQEKYKDDKAQQARAQMELFKQHKVNPASSCLPMLIQMPILIWVYYGIRYFVYRFEGVSFLYLKSLADPDVVSVGGSLWPGPLLLVYGLSMYFSQKLISTPAATPEQQQQQKMMSFLMPVLFVIILKGLPAAFILYWLLQNILMTGHQYLIVRPQRQTPAPAGPSDSPAPPPPDAVPKPTQGGQPRRKKKKRR